MLADRCGVGRTELIETEHDLHFLNVKSHRFDEMFVLVV
jgi:hypothetical protein